MSTQYAPRISPYIVSGLLSSNLNEVSGTYGPDPVYNQRLIQVGLASTFLLAGELLAAVETNVDEQVR